MLVQDVVVESQCERKFIIGAIKTSTIYSKAWKNKLDTIQTTFIYIEKENKKLQKFSMDASLYSLYIVYCIYLRLSENIVYTLRLSGKGKFVHNFDPK